MNFNAAGVSVLFMLIGALIQFLVIYFAVRLALKHDRERFERGRPQR